MTAFPLAEGYAPVALAEGGLARPSAICGARRAAALTLVAGAFAALAVVSFIREARLTAANLPAAEALFAWPPFQPACDPHDDLVKGLRSEEWPKTSRREAPTLARAMYINLDVSMDRRRFMDAELPHLGFAVERLEAATIADVGADDRCPEILVNNTINPSSYPNILGKWAVVACECSHYLAAKRIAAEAEAMRARNELWLILEDDVAVTAQVHEMWRAAWPYVPDDWDVLRVGWFGSSFCPYQINEAWDLAYWSDPPPDGPCEYCGLQAYILNPDTVDRVIQRYERSRLYHADCLLGAQTPPGEDETQVPPLRAFAMRQCVADQDYLKFGSVIGSFSSRDDNADDAPAWARNSDKGL